MLVNRSHSPSVPDASVPDASVPDDSVPDDNQMGASPHNSGPPEAGNVRARREIIEGLRSHIGRIEGTGDFVENRHSEAGSWTLGVPVIDELLGPSGIDARGVHEIRFDDRCKITGAAAATAARRTFALLLSLRRLMALKRAGPILWALPLNALHETGTPYSHGLRALGIDPDRLIIVTPRKSQDVLWVLEEALRSGSMSMILGEVANIGATSSRRLSLAAATAHCPCILLSQPGSVPAVAVASRWRVAPKPSGDDDFDVSAPGVRRFAIALERCRSRPVASDNTDFVVEWSDGARCFGLVAAVPDRAHTPGSTAAQGRWEGVHRRIA